MRKNRKIAGRCVFENAVAVGVLSVKSDVRVCRKRTFKFFEGLDKIKPDDG